MTSQKYQKRLAKFFDFLGIEGSTVEDKNKKFIDRLQVEENNNNNKQWVFNNLIRFMQFRLDKVNKKEITIATVRNYVKSIKLFCEMADIQSQKKITRGLPRGKIMQIWNSNYR